MQQRKFGTSPRRLTVGALLLAATVALSACSSSGSGAASSSPSPGSGHKGAVIGFAPPVSIPAFVDMFNAMQTQAKSLGMTVVQAGGGGFDQAAQIQALNSLIARHVDVIVSPPLSPQAVQPVMERAEAAGIKWIDYDSDIKNPTLTIQSDEVANAAVVAEQLAKALKAAGKECKLGIINGAPVVTALVRTAQGFQQGAEAAGCTILDTQTDTTNEQSGGQSIGNAWKARFGTQMTGVLSYVGSVTLGLLSTFNKGAFDPEVGSEASSPAYRAAVASGAISVGFDSETAQIGQGAVFAAAQLLDGVKLPRSLVSPVRIITAKTVASLPPADAPIKEVLKVTITETNGKATFAYSYPK